MQHFNLIKRNFWFFEQEAKSTLYKELVRPKIEYASVMWDPAARFCKSDYKYTSNVTVVSFASRRKKSLVVHRVQDYTQSYPHAQT